MAEEDVLVATADSPVQLSDHEKKRKLGDLEIEAPEPLSGVDLEGKRDGDGNDGNADQDEGDESELKRPRLEDNVEQPGLGISFSGLGISFSLNEFHVF